MAYPAHTETLTRLKKIAGQIQGIQRMIAGRRYCIDIIQQLTAVRRAVDEAALQVMRGHIDACVSESIRSKAGAEKVDELMRTIHRFVK